MLMLLCAELVNGLKTAKTCCVQSFVLVTDTRKKEKKNLLQQFKSRFLSKMKSNTFLNNVSQCLLKASRCFVTLEMEIRGQSLFLIYTLGQTGGIMGMTLFDPCQKNNSNWRGGKCCVPSTHNPLAWQPLFLLLSWNFRSSQCPWSSEKTSMRAIQVKCAITSSPVDKTAQRK